MTKIYNPKDIKITYNGHSLIGTGTGTNSSDVVWRHDFWIDDLTIPITDFSRYDVYIPPSEDLTPNCSSKLFFFKDNEWILSEASDIVAGKQYICTKNNEEQRVRVIDSTPTFAVVVLIVKNQETEPVTLAIDDYAWEEVENIETTPHKEDKKYLPACESQYDLLNF